MDKTDDEVNLTLGDIEDATAFDEMYRDWDIRHQIPLADEHLKTICRLWFGRGIARGTTWADDQVTRLTNKS